MKVLCNAIVIIKQNVTNENAEHAVEKAATAQGNIQTIHPSSNSASCKSFKIRKAFSTINHAVCLPLPTKRVFNFVT